jgi:adenylate cyclase
VEQQIAVLFCDIRGFTSLSENHLSYDVVYLLNRYHQIMTEAIEAAGGYIDKYIGDGIMAIFGVSDGPQKGCAQSIDAVLKMRQALDVLNSEQHRAAEGDLRIGIGVHTGHAILGRIGASGHSAAGLTALGDMVNTASRLESATKDQHSFAIISKDVFETAQVDLRGVDWIDIEVRGRQQPIQAMSVKSISDLADLVRKPTTAVLDRLDEKHLPQR